MRKSMSLLALVLGACSATPPGEPGVPEDLPALTPPTVPAPSVDWQSFSDFGGLREAYARRQDYSERCESSRPGEKFREKMDASDFQGAYEITRNYLQDCPVDAQVHLWHANLLYELGQPEQSGLHMKWFIGLTDSAMSGGDGKSPETPYVTISVPEEYAILARLRLKPVRQALVEKPTMLDAITATDADGREQTLYFEPRWHFIRLYHRVKALTD